MTNNRTYLMGYRKKLMTLLTEKKDHIINKIPSLTPEQKTQIIAYFIAHPTEENKINWNNWQRLTYADFQPIITVISKTAKKKAVRTTGIKGLEEGTDYFICYNKGGIIGYIPHDYEASKLIASRHVGEVEGKWCTAYQKDSQYWNQYVGSEENILVYFVNYGRTYAFNKAALRIINRKRYEIWDEADDKLTLSYEGDTLDGKLKHPPWFFNQKAMESIIKVAYAKVQEAGGLDAENEKRYSIYTSVGADIEDDYTVKGYIEFQQGIWEGEDYETESVSDEDYSSFYIIKAGKGIPVDNNTTKVLGELEKFNPMNGTGAIIEYENGHTPAQAERHASQTLQGDSEDFDYYEIKQALKSIFDEPGEKIDYLIVSDPIDEYLTDLMSDYFDFMLPFNQRTYGNIHAYEEMEDGGYTIYYQRGYNFTKKQNWVTSPSQRAYDKQLDLPYGL
jgi:hypothetical protein